MVISASMTYISPSMHKTFLGLMSDKIYMSFSKCSALFRPSSCARRPRASVDDALSPIGSQSVSLIVQRDVASLFDESLVLTYSVYSVVFAFGVHSWDTNLATKIQKKSHICKDIWEILSNFCCFQEKWYILRAKVKSNA